jgi:hypothetical protein
MDLRVEIGEVNSRRLATPKDVAWSKSVRCGAPERCFVVSADIRAQGGPVS